MLNIFPAITLICSIKSLWKYYSVNHLNKHYGIKYALLILSYGVAIDSFFNTIVLDICLFTSLIIVFISEQNPVFFKSDDVEGMYNLQGFISLVNEYFDEKKKFYLSAINISNYNSLKTRYDVEDFYAGMECFGEWIQERNKEAYMFYTNNECINIVSAEPIHHDDTCGEMFERIKEPFVKNNIEMYIWVNLLDIKVESASCKNATDIIRAEKYMLDKIRENEMHITVDDEIFKKIEYNNKIERIVQECIDNNEIEIYIQPIYNPKTCKIEGGEVLTRIQNKELGLIMPDDFIGLSEQNGNIFNLSLLIFEKTCIYLSENNFEAYGIEFINVNCSPVQFHNINLVDELKAIANKHGVPFSIFDFEVIESKIKYKKLLDNHISKINKDCIINLDTLDKKM